MTIQEQNRVICVFMGGYRYSGVVWFYVGPDGFEHETGDFLKYHSDWNWLMPAWVKFRNLNLDSKEYSEWCSSLGWYLYSSDEPSRFCERVAYAIQWYNTLKK